MSKLWQLKKLSDGSALSEPQPLPENWGPIFGLHGHEHYKADGLETVACCDFDFPGRNGMHARWDLGDSTIYISECDMDAWQATADAGRSTGLNTPMQINHLEGVS